MLHELRDDLPISTRSAVAQDELHKNKRDRQQVNTEERSMRYGRS